MLTSPHCANTFAVTLSLPVLHYFGYGSNLHLPALKAKGVTPRRSVRARLHGWQLAFDVRHWFPHEGGMGNIHRTDDPADVVEGVLHVCDDEALVMLDRLEAYGVGYDRVVVPVETDDGTVHAQAYVGLPAFLDASCRPTRRYLNILLRGALAAGLPAEYIRRLEEWPALPEEAVPEFVPPTGALRISVQQLAGRPELTALCGHVFDMSAARAGLASALPVLAARDTTLFHLHRHDSCDGSETLSDVQAGTISLRAQQYLAAWLHAYAAEFRYAGVLDTN